MFAKIRTIFKKPGRTIRCEGGDLLERLIAYVLIGGLAYTLLTTKVSTPLTNSMSDLGTKITNWTSGS